MHLKEFFNFLLRNKDPKDFYVQEMAQKIEDNVFSSRKVDLFGSSRESTFKVEAKPSAMNSNDPTL
jgi:hypothetical protein